MCVFALSWAILRGREQAARRVGSERAAVKASKSLQAPGVKVDRRRGSCKVRRGKLEAGGWSGLELEKMPHDAANSKRRTLGNCAGPRQLDEARFAAVCKPDADDVARRMSDHWVNWANWANWANWVN
ncbi:hypothetical protein FGG08_005180 [Glutinoglossum americanum]|uniref:Uncharacterized protein n=1 Tax=Glutinoglossum americanum TaxID=1670608 RepID=A0A9P8HYY4_9PEZI|nr:hypothetical protein FGG08_005180 [Glutinoglossum americanum]